MNTLIPPYRSTILKIWNVQRYALIAQHGGTTCDARGNLLWKNHLRAQTRRAMQQNTRDDARRGQTNRDGYGNRSARKHARALQSPHRSTFRLFGARPYANVLP